MILPRLTILRVTGSGNVPTRLFRSIARFYSVSQPNTDIGINSTHWKELSKIVNKNIIPKIYLLAKTTNNKFVNRVGVLINRNKTSSKVLSALLLDPYLPDQSWINMFQKRYNNVSLSNNNSNMITLVKYNETFQINKIGNVTVYEIPSPYLKTNNVEFVEYYKDYYNINVFRDNCYMYLNILSSKDTVNAPDIIYPHINVVEDGVSDLLSSTVYSVDFAAMLETILDFRSNKQKNTSKYKEVWVNSGMSIFVSKLSGILSSQHQRALYIRNLEKIVIDQLLRKDPDLIKFNTEFKLQDHVASSEISHWYSSSHKELQSKIMNLKPVSLWKIYSSSESNLQLQLLAKLDPKNWDMFNNLNYVKGKLGIQSDNNKLPHIVLDHSIIATKLHSFYNKSVFTNFFTLQLPLVLISVIGVLSNQFSMYSMGSLASVGIVLGVKKVFDSCNKFWHKTLDQDVVDPIRMFIENESIQLKKQARVKSSAVRENVAKKLQIIKQIELRSNNTAVN
ncbi:uncharacterized protein SCODWIG_01862 [Saccharomycodes ludwigii]|uniref:Mmc1 C-terminal domain-containing protein n=1 Tax=Saccharomycodes ludwigii TaxID=36035 RepID=A0A376B639_9ASCO|nr:uncharacterized protein SCODWIG_01862 [Saccharomycodes ludwigii]